MILTNCVTVDMRDDSTHLYSKNLHYDRVEYESIGVNVVPGAPVRDPIRKQCTQAVTANLA